MKTNGNPVLGNQKGLPLRQALLETKYQLTGFF
jgi:hypothetical protein